MMRTVPSGWTILPDYAIRELCTGEHPMVSPFELIQKGRPTYGLGSFGYDIRLGWKFLVPRYGGLGLVLDPCQFPAEMFTVVELEKTRETIEIAPHSGLLAESMESFAMPEDVIGLCLGKSTYARCGLLVNATPLEPGWRGRLTLELVNLSPYPIRLYVGQGIAQILFFRGPRPDRTYGEKESGGRYQDQPGILLPK